MIHSLSSGAHRSRRSVTAIALALAGLPLASAFAVDYDFVPVTGTVNWNDGANWTTLPGPDDATFPSVAGDFANLIKDFTGNTVVNLNQDVTIGRLDLGDTTNAASPQTVTIASGTGTNTLIFDATSGNAKINLQSASGTNTGIAATISSSVRMLDNLDITNGRTQFQFTGPTMDLGANVLTVGGNGALASLNFGAFNQAAQGLIVGSGSVVVNYTTVSAAASFFGPSTFTGGLTFQNGLLVSGVSSAGGIDGAVTSGPFGTGTLTIEGASAASTNRVIRSTGSGNTTIGNSIAAKSDFTIGQSATTTTLTLSGTMTLSGNRVIGVEGGNGLHTISGVISDGGGNFNLIKTGASALRLSGASTYTGSTIIRNNTIILLANAASGVAGPLGNSTSPVQLGDSSAGANNNGVALRIGADNVTMSRDILVTNQNGTGVSNIGNTGDFTATYSGGISLQRTMGISGMSATKQVEVTGLISGTGGIVKVDAGIARVNNSNSTFTGVTTVRRGTLFVVGDVGVSTNSSLGNAASAIVMGDTGSAAGETATLSIDGAFTISRGVTVNNNGGTLALSASNATSTVATYAGGITLNKVATLANATAGATTRFSGVITDGAGSFGVTINGPGIVEFSGAAAHSYNGPTNVASGTLLLNSAAAGGVIIGDANTGTVDVVIGGGTLLFGASNQLASDTTIQFTSGTLDLGGNAQTIFDLDYTGGAILNAGGLTITNGTDLFLFDGTTINTPTVLGRKLIYAGTATASSVTGNIALDADPAHEFAINNGAAAIDAEVTGVISNETTASTLTKRGNGVLKLSAAAGNTFGGAGQTVTIEGGSLAVTQDNQLGNSANTITFTGGALRFDSAFSTSRTMNVTASGGGIETPSGVTATISNAGQIAGNGNFVKSGAGVLEITANQSASWTGGSVTLAGGTLRISAENQLGAAGNDVTFQGGGLEVTTGFVADAGKVFTLGAGGGTLTVAAGQTVSINTAGGLVGNTVLTKAGAGSLVLSAANAGLTAGAGVNVVAGTLELQNAQSLGNSPKATVTLGGGLLSLRNDAATSFSNPVVVSANSTVMSDVVTPAAAGVAHTLGALSIGGATLTADVGANVAGGAPAVTFASTALTGNSTLQATASAQLSTGAIALGTNKLTLAGNGTINLSAAISGGPGAGLVAIEKTGTGTGIATTTGTFVGDTVINDGVLRLNAAAALGAAANVVVLNGGTLQQSSTGSAYGLRFNGGTLAPVGGDRIWNGATSSTPSIIFEKDTTFSLTDGLTPTTDRALDFGATAGNTGVVTSVGPVNITVTANATNTASLKKVRFNNLTDSGSVTGTLTIQPNAIAQIRSGGGTQNALGSGVLLKLNTGINLADTDNSGRLEVISDFDVNYGNDVELLGDSTINPQRINTALTTSRTMTLNDLLIGNHTLVVDDASGNNYNVAFDGTTTLAGSPTFHLVNGLTLANITDGAGTFGITKNGASTLAFNGGGYDGPTIVNAGTLSLGADGILKAAADLTVSGGTLNLNTFNQAAAVVTLGGTASVTVSGTGTLTAASIIAQPATGQTVTVNAVLAASAGLSKIGAGTLAVNAPGAIPGLIDIIGGAVTQGVANAFTAANDVTVNGGRIDYLGKSGILHNVSLSGQGNVNALGLLTGTNATGLVTAEVTGTLVVNGDTSSVGTSVTVNSGGMGANLVVNKLVIQSGTMVAGSGAIFVGGNAPGSSLTIGSGGLELSNIASGAYNAIYVASSGGTSKLNLGGNVKFTGNDNPSPVRITGVSTGSGGLLDLGAADRTFDIGDGAGSVDVSVGIKITGAGGITKVGTGTLEIGNPGTPHAYFGPTTVNAGTLLLTGNISGSVTTVNAGGTLQVDAGGVAGPVNIEGGTLTGSSGFVGPITAVTGKIVPGVIAGTLDTGDLLFGPNADLQMEIGGYVAGIDHDQLRVTGSLTIGGELQPSLINGFLPFQNDTFFIMLNDGVDPVVGAFAGLSEGAGITFGDFPFTITYLANGDFGAVGNDIALIAVPEPGSALLLLAGLGVLSRRRRSTR